MTAEHSETRGTYKSCRDSDTISTAPRLTGRLYAAANEGTVSPGVGSCQRRICVYYLGSFEVRILARGKHSDLKTVSCIFQRPHVRRGFGSNPGFWFPGAC